MQVVSARQGRILRLLRLHGSVDVSTVAEHLNVSAMTIRRDLAHLAEQGIVERVHGGAVLKPPPASGPVPGTALRFAMMTPTLGYYYGQVLRGAERAATELGVQLVCVEHKYDGTREAQLLERLAGLDADGLILSTSVWPVEMGRPLLEQLEQLPAPVVLCERPTRDQMMGLQERDLVATDHAHGIWLAMRHLHALGHRRIVWVARDLYDARVRQQVVLEAAEALGVDVLDLTGKHPGHHVPHRDACREIVAATIDAAATAMLVHSDLETLTLLPALRAAGLRVPADISVVSSDDERVAAASTPVTAISPPKFEIGWRAVELLHRRTARAGQRLAAEHVWVLPSLVVRASTAPPP